MSTLDNIQTSFSRLTDVTTAQMAWRSLVSSDPRVISALATYSRPTLKSIRIQATALAASLRAAAAGYYKSGATSVAGSSELVDLVSSVRARLLLIRESDGGSVSVSLTPERVRATVIKCPLVNNNYTLTVNDAVYEIEHRPASLQVAEGGAAFQGAYLYAFGQVVLRSRFNTNALPAGWAEEDGVLACADDVVCVIPDKSAASRSRGVTRSGALPGVFITAREVQRIAGGEMTTRVERREISVSSGEVSDVDDYTVVSVGADRFVVVGGRLIELDTATLASELEGDVLCDLSTSTLTFSGVASLSDPSYVTFITDGGELLEGDVGDGADGTPSTRVALEDALSALPLIEPLSITSIMSPSTAAEAANYAIVLDGLSQQAAYALDRLSPTRQRTLIDELLSRMERAGLDRAADILRDGDVRAFLALTPSDATYAAVLRDAGSQLKVQVQQ